MNVMKKPLFTIIFLLASTLTFCQSTYFNIDATTFFRDAEYFMPFTKGYTISGFRFTPSFNYSINQASFRAGAMVEGIAGTDGFGKIHPVLTISYRPCDKIVINMGTLDGSLNHHLGEPLYDFERYFIDYKEDGLQVLTHTEHWESDTWINWEKFLEPWTPSQEQFVLGSRHSLLFQGHKRWSFQIPELSFLGAHRGGQFTSLDTCIETLFNEAVSMSIMYGFNDNNSLGIMHYAYFFQNMSPSPHTAFERGYALYPMLKFCHQKDPYRWVLMAGYWHGNQFLSARGSWLYQSASWHDADYRQPIRNMLTLSAIYSHRIKQDFILDFTAEGYYDLDLKAFDFSVGLLMHFSNRWALGKKE